MTDKPDLKYTFIYVPEGKEINYEQDEDIEEIVEDKKIIKDYLKAVMESGYTARTVTSTHSDRIVLWKVLRLAKLICYSL